MVEDDSARRKDNSPTDKKGSILNKSASPSKRKPNRASKFFDF